MSVAVEWDNEEKTILRYDMEGRWTWNEFIKTYEQGLALVTSVEHCVHFIVNPLDRKSRGYLPPNVMIRAIRLYQAAPSNAGFSAIIGGGDFFRILNQITHRLYPRIAERYLIVDSLDEARAILQKKMAETR